MSRLLEAKRNIILHFGQTSSWTNLFDDSFIDSALRRSRTTTSGNTTTTASKDGKFTRVEHKPAGKSQQEAVLNWLMAPANANGLRKRPSFLEVTRDGDNVVIRDESDRIFSVDTKIASVNDLTADGVAVADYADFMGHFTGKKTEEA